MTPKWIRAFILLGAFVLLTAQFVWYFGDQAYTVWESQSIAKEAPCVSKTPVPPNDTSLAPAKGAPVTYLGYTFSLPWDDLDEEQTVVRELVAILHFRSHRAILISNAQLLLKGGSSDSLEAGKQVPPEWNRIDPQRLFQIDKETAETTPSQFTIFTARQSAKEQLIHLYGKSRKMDYCRVNGIFSITTPEFHGFQYNSSSAARPRADIDLYDYVHAVHLAFADDPQLSASISQAEINLVLQSLRAGPDADTTHLRKVY